MSRKTRIYSTAAAVAVAKASSEVITAPSNVPLKDCDLPFFASVIDEFARSEWTAHQLELAAMLARKMRLLRDELETLEDEGFSLAREGQAPCQTPDLGAFGCWTPRSWQPVARCSFMRAREAGRHETSQSGVMR